MLDYCDKCGWIWQRNIQKEHNNDCGNCEICGNQLKPVPNCYYEEFQGIHFLSDDMKQKLIDKLILTSSNFDKYYFDNAVDIKGQKDNAFNAKIEYGKTILEENSRSPKCTYCGSSNIKKVGLINRTISIELWGLGSKKIGKQFHCNKCGADFWISRPFYNILYVFFYTDTRN